MTEAEMFKRPNLTVSQYPRMSDTVRHKVSAHLETGMRFYEFMCDTGHGADTDAAFLEQVAHYCKRMAMDVRHAAGAKA